MKTVLLACTTVLALTLAAVAVGTPCAAQRRGRTLREDAISYSLDGPGTTLSYDQADLPTRSPGANLRHTGTALMAIGVTSQVSGALGGFFGLLLPWGCNSDFCGVGGVGIAAFTTGMVTAGLGLVAFFVGMGLDIRGRILDGTSRRVSLGLDAGGATLRF
jgi:hypothetical protein